MNQRGFQRPGATRDRPVAGGLQEVPDTRESTPTGLGSNSASREDAWRRCMWRRFPTFLLATLALVVVLYDLQRNYAWQIILFLRFMPPTRPHGCSLGDPQTTPTMAPPPTTSLEHPAAPAHKPKIGVLVVFDDKM